MGTQYIKFAPFVTNVFFSQLSECEAELGLLKEALKGEKSEAYKWKDLVKELRSLLDGKNSDMETKREEVSGAPASNTSNSC